MINWDYREGEGPVEDYIEPMGLFSLCMDDAHELRRDPLPVASHMRRLIEKGEPSGAGSTVARR
ncbi:MAG: hypothetical protein H0V97_12715 [Actinobacteria bacterium]|nr:hypothetical protein [Actinomycetota bacterium]